MIFLTMQCILAPELSCLFTPDSLSPESLNSPCPCPALALMLSLGNVFQIGRLNSTAAPTLINFPDQDILQGV